MEGDGSPASLLPCSSIFKLSSPLERERGLCPPAPPESALITVKATRLFTLFIDTEAPSTGERREGEGLLPLTSTPAEPARVDIKVPSG